MDNYFEPLQQFFIKKGIALTDSEWDEVMQMFEKRIVEKKEYLLKQDHICTFEAYVVKGCLKTYMLDTKGNEVVIYFSIEDWWVGDLRSFHFRTPSIINIQALERTEIAYISVENYSLLLNRFPQFERIFYFMLQSSMSVFMQRYYNYLAKSAEERYEEFVRRYPKIYARVPLQSIASYLGITPEFLSKIRAKK